MAEVENTGRFKFEAAPVTLFSPAVISPKVMDFKNGRKSDPMYQVQAGIRLDHPELAAIKAVAARVAKEKFGTTTGVSFPFSDGTKKADKAKAKKKNLEFMRDFVILRSFSKQYAPSLFYVSGGQVVEVDEAMRSQAGAKFYSGVDASIEVNFVAYEGTKSEDNPNGVPNSVVAYLSSVCSLGTGKKVGGGGADRYSGFAKNVGTVSDEDVTDEGGDEIPM